MNFNLIVPVILSRALFVEEPGQRNSITKPGAGGGTYFEECIICDAQELDKAIEYSLKKYGSMYKKLAESEINNDATAIVHEGVTAVSVPTQGFTFNRDEANER